MIEPTRTPSTTPSREELLKLIDSELQSLATESARSGATHWTLSAALAALLWALVTNLRDARPTVGALACAFVAVNAVVDSLSAANLALSGESLSKSSTRFNPIVTVSSRPAVAWSALSCALLAVAAMLSTEVPQWVRFLISGFYASLFALLAILIGVSFTKAVAAKDSLAPRLASLSALVTLVFLLVVGHFFVRRALLDWRALSVALILVASQRVVSKLLVHDTTKDLEQTLKSARRDLVIGSASAEHIATRVDVALLGLRASDVLADEAVALARALGDTEDSVRDFRKTTLEFLEQGDDLDLETAIPVMRKASARVGAAVSQARKTSDALTTKVNRLVQRTRSTEARSALLAAGAVVFEDAAASVQRVDEAVAEVDRRVSEFVANREQKDSRGEDGDPALSEGAGPPNEPGASEPAKVKS